MTLVTVVQIVRVVTIVTVVTVVSSDSSDSGESTDSDINKSSDNCDSRDKSDKSDICHLKYDIWHINNLICLFFSRVLVIFLRDCVMFLFFGGEFINILPLKGGGCKLMLLKNIHC